LIFSWRLVFSVCPFFWASKTFHHGALGPTGPEANVLRQKNGSFGKGAAFGQMILLWIGVVDSLHWCEMSVLKTGIQIALC